MRNYAINDELSPSAAMEQPVFDHPDEQPILRPTVGFRLRVNMPSDFNYDPDNLDNTSERLL